MAKVSAKTNVDHVEAAIYHLSKIIEPAQEALAKTPARVGDNGHETRRNGSLRFVFQGLGNTLEHQLRGQMPGEFRNATKMVTDSMASYAALQRKHVDNTTGLVDEDSLVVDPGFGRTTAWLDFNLCNEQALNQLLVVAATIVEQVSGQSFKATPIVTKQSTAIASAMDEAAKKAAKAINDKLKAKVAA